MQNSLFTELTNAEQETLTGGADYYYFNKDKWDVYRYYDEDKGGYYYKVYEDGYDNKESGSTFID